MTLVAGMGVEVLVVLVLGVLVGVVVGMLGAGGSILTVPALMLLLGFTATEATGTSLVVVIVVSSVGLVTHGRAGRVAWATGLAFAAIGVPAAFAGGFLARWLADTALTVVLVALMLATALWMWRRRTPEGPGEERPPGWIRTLPAGSAVGLMTGTLGVGGGFAVVPTLSGVLRLSMPVAVGTSQLVLAVNALAGLAARLGTATVAWTVGLLFATGGAVGAALASRIVGRIRPDRLPRLFAALLVLVALGLVADMVW